MHTITPFPRPKLPEIADQLTLRIAINAPRVTRLGSAAHHMHIHTHMTSPAHIDPTRVLYTIQSCSRGTMDRTIAPPPKHTSSTRPPVTRADESTSRKHLCARACLFSELEPPPQVLTWVQANLLPAIVTRLRLQARPRRAVPAQARARVSELRKVGRKERER